MDNDHVLDNDETSDIDDPSIPALFIRDDDSCDAFGDESIVDYAAVSENAFDDDITVIVKELTVDKHNRTLVPSLSVHSLKERYFNLVGLRVDRQRMLFGGKMMSDKATIHSHGVVN